MLTIFLLSFFSFDKFIKIKFGSYSNYLPFKNECRELYTSNIIELAFDINLLIGYNSVVYLRWFYNQRKQFIAFFN